MWATIFWHVDKWQSCPQATKRVLLCCKVINHASVVSVELIWTPWMLQLINGNSSKIDCCCCCLCNSKKEKRLPLINQVDTLKVNCNVNEFILAWKKRSRYFVNSTKKDCFCWWRQLPIWSQPTLLLWKSAPVTLSSVRLLAVASQRAHVFNSNYVCSPGITLPELAFFSRERGKEKKMVIKRRGDSQNWRLAGTMAIKGKTE